jgi:hypothetical protein
MPPAPDAETCILCKSGVNQWDVRAYRARLNRWHCRSRNAAPPSCVQKPAWSNLHPLHTYLTWCSGECLACNGRVSTASDTTSTAQRPKLYSTGKLGRALTARDSRQNGTHVRRPGPSISQVIMYSSTRTRTVHTSAACAYRNVQPDGTACVLADAPKPYCMNSIHGVSTVE